MRFHEKIRQERDRGRLGKCTCWDHLRAAGITPKKSVADSHRICTGQIMRVDNGKVNRSAMKREEDQSQTEEAVAA